MSKKHIRINIFCKKLPFLIKIYDFQNNLIFQKFLTKDFTVLDVCTFSTRLIFVAKFNAGTQKKILLLSNCCFQNYFVAFDFWQQSIAPNPAIQNISLFDVNYGIPISGQLNFTKQ